MKINASGYFTVYKTKEISVKDSEIEHLTQAEREQYLDQLVNTWVSQNMSDLKADEYGDVGYEVVE